MKKLVAFIGSPLENGRTANFVEEIVRGAKQAGASAKIYTIHNMDIKFCQSCMYCKKEGDTCIIKDDMQAVYKDLYEADAVVFGSPVYVHQASAQTKVLFDRLFALVDSKLNPRFNEKKVVVVYTQNNDDPEAFRSYFDINTSFMNDIGLKVMDTIIYAGHDENKKKDLIKRAFCAGKMLVE